IGVFAYLGLDSASQRSFFDYSETQERERNRVLSTGLWTLVLSTGVLAGLCAVLSPAIADVLFHGRYAVVLALGFAAIPPVSLSMWVLQLADRFFVLHYRSLSELGVYAVGVKLANLLFLAVTGFALAWSPLMLELHKRDQEGERAFRARVLTYVTFALCLG